jgi:N-methylhydantoinase B
VPGFIGRPRTKIPSWAQRGGQPGAPNRLEIDFPDGHSETVLKATDRMVPAGSRLRIYCGGGGGYGAPAERAPEAAQRDLLSGLVTSAHAQEYYRHTTGAAQRR